MKVAVTGGTGYLGAHTTRAVLADGHHIRLLVHPDESVSAVLPLLGPAADRVEVLRGDIRDPAVVATLLDGCDAVLHAAGVVGTDNRRETLMWEVNTAATATLLTRAAALGLDPIVHVASSVMRPGRGPRRYMCGGELIAFDELIDILEYASRRRLKRIPLAPAVFRGIGRIADALGAVLPVNAGLSYEAAWLLTAATPTDDSRTLSELGLTWRPVRAALSASVRAPAAGTPEGVAP